ncbi:hypothetical protein H4J63_17930 [Pseudoalteromonas sp. 5Ae-yellow]|uniref:hypothetical protein n=1 Tax=Pseudoalteromonas sp. 5Ae-yellow TaxID=2759847 RepID=UPI0015F56396|nr:hypothetical protein [Pseudoalteromonas sp. 5Ae-yellow]MBA6411152.1 hypothetical protein [Pseudoalteromonas sp. 5Ae-yellow]
MSEINVQLKIATSLAKGKRFDEAIEVLQAIIPKMGKTGGYSHSSYTKIIPYFQKAGRYLEVEEYCKSDLFEAVVTDCRNVLGHQPEETIIAFINLFTCKIFDKLRFCAQKENDLDSKLRFEDAGRYHYEIYEKWLDKQGFNLGET